jgi:hypothetical protein
MVSSGSNVDHNPNESTPTAKNQISNTHQSFLSTGQPNTATRGRVNSNSRQKIESKQKRKSSDKRQVANKKGVNEMPAVNTRSNSRGNNGNYMQKEREGPQFYD